MAKKDTKVAQFKGIVQEKLSVLDRFTLLSILPQTGDFLTLKIMRKLREALSFNEEDHAAYRFEGLYRCKGCGYEAFLSYNHDPRNEDCAVEDCNSKLIYTGSQRWDNSVPQEREIEIGDIGRGLIVSALKKLDEEKKLTERHFGLYEKFVGE